MPTSPAATATPTDAEIEAMVAEVMGWTRVEAVPHTIPSGWRAPEEPHWFQQNPPACLTDWRDFGKVWEWLASQREFEDFHLCNRYAFIFRHPEYGDDQVTEDHPNPRRALCLALLKAKGKIE